MKITGYQDTLFPNSGRSYFHKCEVWGHVDFIFGAGQVVFDDCDIVSRDRGSKTNNGYVTAPSTKGEQSYRISLFAQPAEEGERRDVAELGDARPPVASVRRRDGEQRAWRLSIVGWTITSATAVGIECRRSTPQALACGTNLRRRGSSSAERRARARVQQSVASRSQRRRREAVHAEQRAERLGSRGVQDAMSVMVAPRADRWPPRRGRRHPAPPTHVYLIGDSTMADKPTPDVNPERGWGQLLPRFFDEHVAIRNHAVNGRSTKSFIDEGRWAAVLRATRAGRLRPHRVRPQRREDRRLARYAAPHGVSQKSRAFCE